MLYRDAANNITIKNIPILNKENFPNLIMVIIDEEILDRPFIPFTDKIYHQYLKSASFIENTFLINDISVLNNTRRNLSKLNCLHLSLGQNKRNVIEVHNNVKQLSLTTTTKIRKIKFKPDLMVRLFSITRIKSLKMPNCGNDKYIKDSSFRFTDYPIRSGNKFLSKLNFHPVR